MIVLIGVGFLAGLITGISPCIVPVLPVIVAAGATSTDRRRPYAVVAGLVITFTAATLGGVEILGLLHLPDDVLTDAGLVASRASRRRARISGDRAVARAPVRQTSCGEPG